MNASFFAKGTKILKFDNTPKVLIFGDVVEGEVKKGMLVHFPFNPTFSMPCVIESVEMIDIRQEAKAYVALVIKIDEDPEEESKFINNLNIKEELLTIPKV